MHIGRSWMSRLARAAALLLLLALSAQADSSEPFGLATVAAPQSRLSAIWQALQAEMKAEQPVIARCRAAPLDCRSLPALQFIAIVDQGEDFKGIARIGHINRAVNFAIRAADDSEPGMRDAWTSPFAALAAGAGDCKQYAVLKYAALQAAGIAAHDLRIVIVAQRARQETHAVVAVRRAGQWLILDNRALALVDSGALLRFYAPLTILDERGVRQFVREPQVARRFGAACAG
jgi:predicted transglutaminase-like cysteine proteinase